MPRNADRPDTVFLKRTGFEYLKRAVQLPGRFGNIACDDQRLRDTGLAGQLCQKLIE